MNASAQGDVEPPDAIAIFGAAQNLHEKGDLAGAIKLYEKALKIVAEFPEAEYQRGIAFLALGNKAAAEKAFRRAVELKSDWTLALTSLGSLLVHKAEYAEAEKLLLKAIEGAPQNQRALTALAEVRLKTNAPANVLHDLLTKIETITAKANPAASTWTARVALESALGKTKAARSSVQNALMVDPNDRTALLQFADMSLADGDIIRATEIAARLEVGTPSEAVKLLKANILAREGKLDDAVKKLDEIPLPNPAAVELRKKINAARSTSTADLEKQLETSPKDPSILGRLCTIYRLDDPAKALAYCRSASEAEPGNINHAVGFGAALVQAKQFDAAVSLFRKILEIAPDNSTAHANLATALFQLKRLSEAKTEFTWLTNAQPKSAGAYLFLGIIHDQSAEYMDAMANYQQYLRLADPALNKLDIEKINLRLPELQRLIKKK